MPLTRLLNCCDSGPLDPCRDDFLGPEFRSWLSFHPFHAQHDARWMRNAIFRKSMNFDKISFHGWEARLQHSTEDRSTLLAYIVLRNMPTNHVTLQQFVDTWHDSKPYINALCSPSQMVCIQLERYSNLAHKNSCAVCWPRTQVTLPVFMHTIGLQIEWISHYVVANMAHLGEDPNSGHCRIVFSIPAKCCLQMMLRFRAA